MKRFAPAKINLSLEILGKRPDGFHNLQSLFLPLSLADELTFGHADAFAFSCSDPGVPLDESNLVVRAASLLGRGSLPKTAIHLKKNIPHSAGLGGGSSDAATTLLALNEMEHEPYSLEELSKMGAELGSDVPFFLHQTAAWCEGRGEIIRPVEMHVDFYVLLFKPPFGVPTPWAYQHLAGSRPLPDISYAKQETQWGTLFNDLEQPVFEKYLYLALVKTWLLEQAEVEGALMSGSGSTMFALMKTEVQAKAVHARMLIEFGPANWTHICRCAD